VRRRRRRGGGAAQEAEGELEPNGGELPVAETDDLPAAAGDAVLAEAEAAAFEPGAEPVEGGS
jgi:hypothetical protein